MTDDVDVFNRWSIATWICHQDAEALEALREDPAFASAISRLVMLARMTQATN